MGWILYSVTSASRVSDGSFQRLCDSITGDDVTLVVGCRGNFDIPHSSRIKMLLVPMPEQISLSDARNLLLAECPPARAAYVAFPDDDCWYPPLLLENVEQFLARNDLVLGVIDTNGSETMITGNELAVHVEEALKYTASAAMFIRSAAIAGFSFDSTLGLGARFGSAEDLDLALWILQNQGSVVFCEGIRVGHPSRNRTNDYFAGSIAAMRKRTHLDKYMWWRMCRRLVHGALMWATGKLTWSTIRVAWMAFRG